MSQEVPDHFRWLYSGDMHDTQDYAARWTLAEIETAAADVGLSG